MRANKLKKIAREGGHALNAWCSLPCAYAAEILANQGYDSVTIDLQHGGMHFETAAEMLRAVSTSDAMPMARVPWNEPGLLMKLLDAGAYGLICPMVNSREEADAFVKACRYPPDGVRSYGPGSVIYYAGAKSGADYAARANDEVLLLAQIETREALANLQSIVSTPGLDGIYVGPGDLSLALGASPSMNPTDPGVVAAIEKALQHALALGRYAAVHTDGPQTARKRFGEGFQLCSLQNDVRLLTDGARRQVQEARQAS